MWPVSAGVIYVALYWLFDRYLWRFVKVRALLKLPDLQGAWVCQAKTLNADKSSGMKKAIRLCKNVKADAESEIALPSFDIAAMMFHADRTALAASQWYELSVLAETQRFVDLLTLNETYAQTLMVPDGSRPIFNTRAKLDALRRLSIELDDLTLQVAREQHVGIPVPDLGTGRQRLKDALIPAL